MPNLKLFQSKRDFIVLLLGLWQFFCILLISLGIWPNSLAWVNLFLGIVFLVLSDSFSGLLFLVASLPFYIVLPNFSSASFSIWRIWFLVLFLVFLMRRARHGQLHNLNLMSWDKYLGFLWLLGLVVTLTFGQFVLVGVKQLVFLLNIYLVYFVLINTVTSSEQIKQLIRYGVYAFTVIITLGFVQLFLTFVVNLDTFWVYWAAFISKVYYGDYFSSVALYSNSWFAYNTGRDLRMFSIMPDSQSFAYLTVLAVSWAVTMTTFVSKKFYRTLWSGIRFASLAMILSGTRAVWVGLLAPLSGLLYFYKKNFSRFYVKRIFWVFLIIFVLFAVSPLINKGLRFLRLSRFEENFLSRLASIYDLQETSNANRIYIWKATLKFGLTHPLGVGPSNFIVSLRQNSTQGLRYEALSQEVNPRYNLPGRYITAHNLYLHIMVEFGILGLLIFIKFLETYLKRALNFLKFYAHEENFLTSFIFTSFLAIIWLLLAAMFDVTLFNDKILMIFFLTLGISGVIMKNYEQFAKT